jgi:MFS family permease
VHTYEVIDGGQSVPHPVSTSSASTDPPHRESPATFRQVFESHEYRAVFSATVLSWAGDFLAKAAVTALVFRQTGSALLAGATFAISFAPWFLIGPVLTAYAERLPRRTVMIVSDIVRMVCIALVALPGLPVPAMIGLLFITALGNPPYDASRSALVATLLTGDRLVVGTSLQLTAGQAAQITGYLAGGLIAAVNPRLALLLDAVTFAVSALLLTLFVKHRPAVTTGERRHIIKETANGFRVVFGTPALRAITFVIFAAMLFAALPEGLGVVWAGALTSDVQARGLYQGLIMLAPAVGFIVGGLIVGRFVPPDSRRRMIRPLAVLAPLTLVPAIFNPPLAVVCAMSFALGFCISGILPAANGLFVQALPNAYRTRAFGVMQSGMQLLQGGSVVAAGYLAQPASKLPSVVGWWSFAGVGLMVVAAMVLWPTQDRFSAAIERAQRLNEATAAG